MSEYENPQKEIIKEIIRIVVATISIFILLYIIYTGLVLVSNPEGDEFYGGYEFSIGVVTILLGLVYIIIGLAILADLALNLTDTTSQEDNKIDIPRSRGIQNEEEFSTSALQRKNISKVIIHLIGFLLSISMLLCAIYKLAIKQKLNEKIDNLPFLLGVVTIAFGTIYFVIGLTVIAELVINLSHAVKQKEDREKSMGENTHSSGWDKINSSV